MVYPVWLYTIYNLNIKSLQNSVCVEPSNTIIRLVITIYYFSTYILLRFIYDQLTQMSLLQPYWIRPINIGTYDVVKYTMWIVLMSCLYLS